MMKLGSAVMVIGVVSTYQFPILENHCDVETDSDSYHRIVQVTAIKGHWAGGQFIVGRVITGIGNGMNTSTIRELLRIFEFSTISPPPHSPLSVMAIARSRRSHKN